MGLRFLLRLIQQQPGESTLNRLCASDRDAALQLDGEVGSRPAAAEKPKALLNLSVSDVTVMLHVNGAFKDLRLAGAAHTLAA